MHHPIRLLPSIATAAILAGSTCFASTSDFVPGDLILGFQNPGGAVGDDKILLVSLGDTANVFRQAKVSLTNVYNIRTIGSLLQATFGNGSNNWWEQTTLYMSAVGVWESDPLNDQLQNLDPSRTVYVSKGRGTLGTEGITGATVTTSNSTGSTGAAGNIFAIGGELNANEAGGIASLTTGTSTFDEKNPFSLGTQGTAYTVFSGGVQTVFTGGTMGSFGGVTNVEAAVDIFRSQAVNNVSGQFGQGQTRFAGQFQGTLVINDGGVISFIVAPVPEPTSLTLLGLATGIFGGCLRRRRAQA